MQQEINRLVSRYTALAAMPPEERSEAIARQAPSQTPGQLHSAYAYYGKHQTQRYIYSVRRLTGNGSWSTILKTPDRSEALRIYETLAKSKRWLIMTDAVTSEIAGQIGRCDLSEEIQNVLNDLRRPDELVETSPGQRRQKHDLCVLQGNAMLAMCTLGDRLAKRVWRCLDTDTTWEEWEVKRFEG